MHETPGRTIVVSFASCLLLASGAIAIGLNNEFELSKEIILAGTGQIGNNWTSIPYVNPYETGGGFCTQTGLTSTGLVRAVITVLDETTGVFRSHKCGTAAIASLPLTPGKGFLIRQPNIFGAPTTITIVGSHDPTISVTVPDAGEGQVGRLWFAVPYHTTAATANDLCLSSGLTSTGVQRATVTRLDAARGKFTTVQCGTGAAAGLALVIGEHVQLVEPNGPKTFLPAHF